MAASYPGSVKTWTPVADSVDTVSAVDMNEAYEEIIALETYAMQMPGSEAQGDVLYYNGSDWSRLAAGTSGQYLKTQGAGANPVWGTVAAGSNWDVIDEVVVSVAAATVTFSSIASGYKHFKIISRAVTDTNQTLNITFNNDTSAGNYTTGYREWRGTATTLSAETNTSSANVPLGYIRTTTTNDLEIMISNYATQEKMVTCTCNSIDIATSSSSRYALRYGVWENTTNEISEIDLQMTSGNIEAGSNFILLGTKGDV
jgi:hypothetical protein